MKRKNLTFAILMICSIAIMLVSGAILVHSATQQSVSSSLQVTFSGDQASFRAEAWYQVENSGTKVALKDSTNHTTEYVNFGATDAPTTKTLELYNPNTIELTASDQYVLFTYKFTNTASDGAYDIKVSLTGTSNEDANLDVKYYTSNSDYNANALTTQKNTVLASSETEFTNVYIPSNNGVKYFYILVKVKDNTIGATFNKSNVNWTITGTQHKSNAVVSFASNSMSVDTSTNAINSTIQGPVLTNTGDGAVTYTSSNTSVATVDSNGVVTIKGTGTATITATASNSTNSSYTTNSTSYVLTVSAPVNEYTATLYGGYNIIEPSLRYQVGASINSNAWQSFTNNTITIPAGQKLFITFQTGGNFAAPKNGLIVSIYYGTNNQGTPIGSMDYEDSNPHIDIVINGNVNLFFESVY